jgi:hypothetical protein
VLEDLDEAAPQGEHNLLWKMRMCGGGDNCALEKRGRTMEMCDGGGSWKRKG